MQEPLYLGLDLSTQQLKAIVVTSNLKTVQNVNFDFDADSKGFQIHKGVITNPEEHEVYAPLGLWLQALDGVLKKLKDTGLDLSRIRGISGAGQQHGSVYWNSDAERILATLDSTLSLEQQLHDAFSHPFSPNWQDASTQEQCELFDSVLETPEALAQTTGSKAHHVGTLLELKWAALTYTHSVSPVLKSFGCSKDTRRRMQKRHEFL
jgi:xylulokinase